MRCGKPFVEIGDRETEALDKPRARCRLGCLMGLEHTSTIWLASLERQSPPREVARNADQVSFGADGELIFRSLAENNALVRIRQDGTGREPISSPPVLDKFDVSPDGQWAVVFSPGAGGTPGATLAVPMRGGAPRPICRLGDCLAKWSSDGRFFYVLNYITNSLSASALTNNKTLAFPVPPGKSLPDLPPGGIDLSTPQAPVPGAQIIDHGIISPGPDPSTYVFTKTDLQRNLFRIPLR